MRRHISRREIWVLGAILLAMSAINCIEGPYIRYLRNKTASLFPEKWEKYPLNGPTNLLVPWIVGDVVIYPAKVNQVRVHGLPYDPYIRENRNYLSWLPDIITF